jgi:hypothetical protein
VVVAVQPLDGQGQTQDVGIRGQRPDGGEDGLGGGGDPEFGLDGLLAAE